MKRIIQVCLVAAMAVSMALVAVKTPAFAQTKTAMTVDQLVAFIKSSVQMHEDDRKVADYIRKRIKLTNKLDDRTVEDLQGQGAGPQTVLALRSLTDATASLPEPPPPAPKPVVVAIPAPNSEEQKKILAEITETARNYSESLPNFICLQVTRRYADSAGKDNYRLLDTTAERLSYFDHKEDYKVISVNGIPVTNQKHDQLRTGVTSSGEFGSMLADIFDPSSQTEFHWERWATLRGRRMYVYNYRIEQANSRYRILHQESGREIISAYHGLIYADKDTQMVMRIKMDCDLPPDFPIQNVSLDMNYDFIKIADQEFVLPLKSELQSHEGRFQVKNEIEFRLYNKFGAEATFLPDAPEPLPDDKTKEQPAGAPKP